jgi:cyclophilin family peptidyl-prolyl cis-trans isomerase
MARTSNPNSAGSQFFLCVARVPHLDRQYTAFGKAADDASLKVIQGIGSTETNAEDRPLKEVKIKTAKVLEKAK